MNTSELHQLKTVRIRELRVECQYCGDLIRIHKDNAWAIVQNPTCPNCGTAGWEPLAGLWLALMHLNSSDRISVRLVSVGE
jgi:hypothetical protein